MKFNSEIFKLIDNSKNVAIVCHIRPDADCLGSASALKSVLLKKDKQVDIYCDSEISQNYFFMKHVGDINKKTVDEYDLVIAVDCSDKARAGKYATMFNDNKNTLLIDHHVMGNEDFAKVVVREPVESTAGLLFEIFQEMGVELDADIACSLYAGLASDTGCFMHSNTTAKTHAIASELIKFNFDLDEVNYKLFKLKTYGQVGLVKKAYANLSFMFENRVAITYLVHEDFVEANVLKSETCGIVDMCANIEGVEVGILISEKERNLYAVSLRGRGANVALIAEKFGGGGHLHAAGCNIFGTAKKVKEKIYNVIKEVYGWVS